MKIKFVSNLLPYTLMITIPLWLIGFVAFLLYVFSFRFNTFPDVDAIVAWTGGEYLIQTAFSLLEKQKGDRLLISGINPAVQPNTFLSQINSEMKDKIALGYQATTTKENAIETAEWLTKNPAKSILLVTSFYHMPRSLLEFKHILPHTTVYPYSIWPKDFTESVAWIHTRSAYHLFVEYHKFLFVKLHYLWEDLVQ